MALATSCPELLPLEARADEAKAAAEAEGAAFAATRGQGFKEWIKHSMEEGGGGLHAYRRGPRGWAPDDDFKGAPARGPERAKVVAAEWTTQVW